jgi:type VI secretion system protein ImpC
MLNCSKDDLLADFEDSPEVPKSGLYKTVYSASTAPSAASPSGSSWATTSSARPAGHRTPAEVRLGVGDGARALHLGGSSPQIFGKDSWEDLPN